MYTIMLRNEPLCEFNPKTGAFSPFTGLPVDLFLEETNEIDGRVNNIENFNAWCASRVLSFDRVHAKAILNSCALKQATTDKEKAKIALLYKCLSLKDGYWVKTDDGDDWEKLNLFKNSLNNALPVALRGEHLTLDNVMMIARDCSTSGVAPKAWQRRADGLYLLKGNYPGTDSAEREYVASRLAQQISGHVLTYSREEPGVVSSKCFTSENVYETSLETMLCHHGTDEVMAVPGFEECFHYMNLVDYITANSDRHWGNICFLHDGRQIMGMGPIYDFNHAFEAEEETPCLPYEYIYNQHVTQRDAALRALEFLNIKPLVFSPVDTRYSNIAISRFKTIFSCRRKEPLFGPGGTTA